MNAMYNKVLIGILTIIFVISLSACYSDSDDLSSTDSSNNTTISVDENEAVEPYVQETPIVEEPSSPQIPNDAISWDEASQYIGETATVYGEVKGIKYATGSNGEPTFINIGENYPSSSRVTALIWEQYRDNFSPSPENQYYGQTICVTGYIDTYDGVVQIEVTSPSQITVIE
jgi:DNA/RNA endonuclease YhcR with UshA esterase domain